MIELEPPPRRIGWMIAAAAAAAVIFAFDLVTPLSYAVPMLYVFPILLTWLAPGRRITLFIAGTVLVLTWVGNLYSPRQFTSDVMANCFLATALLLVIGWLVIKQKRLLEQREADQTTVRESEMRYQRLVEAISAVTWFCPPSGLHIVPQPSWMAFTGQSAEQMLGAGWAQAVHPDDVAAATQRWSEAVVRGKSFSNEHRIRRHDGQWRWMSVSAVPLRNARGEIVEWFGMNLDITERKRAEEARVKAESHYRTIFQEAGVGVAQIDSLTGQFLKVNRKYCEIVGMTEEEMLATTFMSITHPDDLAEDLISMERVRNGEISAFTMEKRYIKKDGSLAWVNLNVAPLWQAGEMPSQHIAVVQDITDRKQMEISLLESEERFRHVFEYAGTGIAIIDLNGIFVRCNPAYCTMIGYREEELRHLAFPSLIHPDDRDENMRAVEALLMKNQPSFEIENRYLQKAGHAVWVHKFVSLLYGKDGKPTHLISLVTDITERKRAEAEQQDWNALLERHVKGRTADLVEANERWNWVVRATNDGVWDWDLVHDTVYYSPRWKEMHGFQEDDPIETMKEWTGRLHPADRPRVLKKLEAYLAGTESDFWEEYRIQRKEGMYIWVLDRGVALWGEEGRAVRMVGAETDITWRKEAEEALQRSAHEFHTLADNVPALFAYIDRGRRYRFINKRYEELFGRSDEQVMGMPVQDLLGPDGYAHVEPYLDKALGGEPVSFEYELKVPGDGTRYLSAQYVPDRDEQGQVIGLFSLVDDVTALKASEATLREREAQLRALSARLLRVQEEERRRIARDLHDDVTQRLAALTLELHGMGRHAVEAGWDPLVVSHVKGLGASVERLTTDVQLMAHHLHPSILDHAGLEAAVREQVDEFTARTGVSVEILTREVPHPLPLEHATCLYRVLQESLQNVRKHAQASNVLVRLLRTSGGIGLCVHDDGQGFEQGQAGRSAKGLGLTSMAERVRLLNGTFRVRSNLGEGTELHAWVPLDEAKDKT